MAGKDLGNKHVCFKCATKFYDFRKPEPLCPKCGADQRQSPALKATPERKPRALAKPAPVEEESPRDEELEDSELDEELDEDDDDDADDDA